MNVFHLQNEKINIVNMTDRRTAYADAKDIVRILEEVSVIVRPRVTITNMRGEYPTDAQQDLILAIAQYHNIPVISQLEYERLSR